MRIRFVINGPDGAPIVSGGEPTDSGDLSAWSNHSSVVRLLRVARVPPVPGQRLVMWVEDDRGSPAFPDDALDRAVEAFHDALATHLDDAAASWSRVRDWVDAPVTSVVEALLWGGWVPPSEPRSSVPLPRGVRGR
ncbi:MAG: hypothetical protein ACRDXB_05505 [Actinomycetes bacterium]